VDACSTYNKKHLDFYVLRLFNISRFGSFQKRFIQLLSFDFAKLTEFEMGSGASAENARTTVAHLLTGKPADASDIKVHFSCGFCCCILNIVVSLQDLEQARAEIRNLRRIARDFQNQLREELKNSAGKNGAKKREAVMDRGEQIKTSTSYVPKVVPKSQSIRDLLLGVVQSNILFSSYAAEEQNAIVDAFESRTFSSGVFIIKQGESGDHFYVVQSGNLEIYVKDKDGNSSKVGTGLGPGSGFGELALMYNTPRAASIKTTSECIVWEIDRQSYRGILVYYKYLRNKQYMEFLRNVEIMEKKLGSIMNESKYFAFL
jgi:hypothetical protein